ncbi:MAG: carbamoyltransferase C-terminal domain-containing protein [Chloroflexota bacterium]
MTKVLGLYDWHNCGAALVEDGQIIAAIEEERLSRTKVDFGMPYRAIQHVLEMTSTDWDDLDAIGVCGIYDPTALVRWKQGSFQFEREISAKWRMQYALWKVFYQMRSFPPLRMIEKEANRRIIHRQLSTIGSVSLSDIHHIDHHLCHANVGYWTSGYQDALVVVIDGSGDGHSATIYTAKDGDLTFIAGSKETASLGKFYANATLGLGFKKLTGEGKLMGLAAYGDPEPYYPHLEHVLEFEDIDTLQLKNNEDLLGNGWSLKIRKDLETFSKEDIAAAVQKRFEDLSSKIVTHFAQKFSLGNVVLVGGSAMNVKLNQKVRESDGIDSTHIVPAMTDSGVSSGAALATYHHLINRTSQEKPAYVRLQNAYLGPGYSNDEVKAVLDRRGYGNKAEYIEDIDTHIGNLVADNAIVARFEGRMEYGPRALGNRSILALATRTDIEDTLNKRLKRDEFMPFAPSIMEEYASEYLENYVYSPFMVETFTVKEEYRPTFPAIVHVDGTLRPQVVRKDVSPGYWQVLQTIGERTGYYLVLNTSYNMHGEPIVCSPDDALNSFEQGPVDYIAMGNWLLPFET